MNYRLQKGIAYQKVKNTIAKYNINGRVMIDPAIFRRIQPNYPLSYIRPDELSREDEEAEEEMSDDCCSSDDDEDLSESEKPDKNPMRVVMWKDSKGKKHPIKVLQSQIDAENGVGNNETTKLETDDEGNMANHVFTEEELLIASPVVLGFAFSEKLWLEFSLSGIEEIQWNAEAFDSLVLPDKIKSNLKGLVSSHRFNAARTIDDVIQGKGKGLNVVLHGPPGVGKTLTGESIAEYLRCPLYAVSAGELGTNSGSLERDLNRIMDITHSWGAILLLDEADVFLEARMPHDIHRNSLVSVFLRLTEYYQGILFLTTNRVETFDEAFQSRIHMGIRYENLKPAARKKIWQHHVGKVEKMAVAESENGKGKQNIKTFTDENFNELAKRNMNGRQVCACVLGAYSDFANALHRSRTRSRPDSRSRCPRRPRSVWSISSVCLRLLRLSRTICVAARAIVMLCNTIPKLRPISVGGRSETPSANHKMDARKLALVNYAWW
jgi:DNA polymerase III delta prime subunit